MRFWRILLVSLILFSASAKAEQCPEWVAKAISIQGTVELRVSETKSSSIKRWQPVKRGDTFCANALVRVKSDSRAALILTNDTVLRLDQNSTITFTDLSASKASKLTLSKGVAHFISRVKQAFEVVTPFVNAAVEGTEFVVAADDKQSQVTVLEGKVRVSNNKGEVLLTKNKIAIAKKDQGPVLNVNLKPRDAVQWALYYPRILESGSSNSTRLINNAANKLAMGRVKQALQDLDSVEKTGNNITEALALKALIALVNNDKSKALKLASQAYENNKQNTSAILAMSYVQQAHFNIEAALNALLHQTNKNALLQARLSELYLMLGDLDKALINAEEAVKLNANLAKTQTVLGFAHLTQINANHAERSFNKAIEFDQADPLPHLGLGLALIRQGQLEQGRREIEYAASLDPNNALIRSYLGKAYYEEKRNKVATDQFDMAKELDANDPTAWFYSAIQKQSTNRPVEALQDLQQSVELNDNRAVYRSRLLLDEDHAARSSGLARIYNDLGFDQLAQQQAFNSINHDFTNHSAHRFLAESYANRSRHEIGRVSELLQSQLLAPINIAPVAPHLSETQLGIQPNAGPSGASFNQYDPLFARNQARFQVSALAGNNNTFGDEVSYSQLFDNTSISLGQYHYETDGFRDNNDYEQDILNALLHMNLTSKQSLQFEVKKNDTENGDLRLRFDPNSFVADRRETRDETSYRLGYHYKLSQSSHFLASIIHRDTLFTRVYNEVLSPVTPTINEVDETQDSKADTAELQYIQKQNSYDLIIGAGSYLNDRHDQGINQVTMPPPVVVAGGPFNNTFERKSTNGYVYTQWYVLNNLNLTLGLSYDDLDDPVFATQQTNPKLGLQWDISSQSQLRLAGFRTLKRELIGNQSLEPTQLAGFNQFYDDPYATDAKNYGLAFEHHFNKHVFTGLELTKRNLVVPISGIGTEGQTEYAHRAYLYWTLNNIVSLTAEYQFEEFEREKPVSNEPAKLTTHKLPFNLNLHYPNGWSGGLTTTYFDQEVIQQSAQLEKDDFWITDARLGYRLGKRLGLINLEVRNLLDEDFNYYDATFRTGLAQPASIYHERSIWLRLALTFD